MFIDLRKRRVWGEGERNKEIEKLQYETSTGCPPYVPQPGIKPTT